MRPALTKISKSVEQDTEDLIYLKVLNKLSHFLIIRSLVPDELKDEEIALSSKLARKKFNFPNDSSVTYSREQIGKLFVIKGKELQFSDDGRDIPHKLSDNVRRLFGLIDEYKIKEKSNQLVEDLCDIITDFTEYLKPQVEITIVGHQSLLCNVISHKLGDYCKTTNYNVFLNLKAVFCCFPNKIH